MPTTPPWSAAQSGLPANQNAVNHAAQVGQELGTHAVQIVYGGSAIVLPDGNSFTWSLPSTGYDHDQPFTMPAGHTAVGRVAVPVLAVGAGADLLVSLCPDDGSGNPVVSSPLATTVIPSSWLTNLATTTGTTDGPTQAATDSPLATPQFNGTCTTDTVVRTWAQPAIGPNGAAAYATPVTSGSYAIFIGGFDPVSSTAAANVASAGYLGEQTLSDPMPQPALPQATYFAAAAATTSALVVVGGITLSASHTTAVWTASWDANNGVVGAWSAQAAYPLSVRSAVAASYDDTVYVVGGTDGTSAFPQVSYARVSNGQLGTWVAAQNLPGAALFNQFVAVVGNWLIVAGGQDTSTTAYNTVYYAKLETDGTPGPWQQGPDLPLAAFEGASQWDVAVTDTAMIIVGGVVTGAGFTTAIQILETSPDSIGSWQRQDYGAADYWQVFSFPEDDGSWTVITPAGVNQYTPFSALKTPLVSVPLPVSGLTAGTRYHVFLRQIGGTPDDALKFGLIGSAYPDGFLYRTAYSTGSWGTDAPNSLNMTIYDASPTGPHSGQWLHTWEDPVNGLASRVTTRVNNDLSYVLGHLSSTVFRNDPLNVNPTFTSGVAPWVATNGTLTQSNAHTQGGLPFSGLLTPTGGFSQAYVQSEQIRVPVNTHFTVDGWLYSPTGWGSVSLSVNWFDSSRTYLDTSFNTVSLAAATWTHLTNVFEAPPGAAYATITPTESGTPGATNLLYLSNVTLTFTDQAAFPSVITVDYDAVTGLPTGTTQLV